MGIPEPESLVQIIVTSGNIVVSTESHRGCRQQDTQDTGVRVPKVDFRVFVTVHPESFGHG